AAKEAQARRVRASQPRREGKPQDCRRGAQGQLPEVVADGGPPGSDLGAIYLGQGVLDNATHAVHAVMRLPEIPDVINMIGWSRGAVTCGVIATMLWENDGLKGIPVNIFAIDPVAGVDSGVGDGSVSRRYLYPNVKNYVSILRSEERRVGKESRSRE